jgi:hypothetical protein
MSERHVASRRPAAINRTSVSTAVAMRPRSVASGSWAGPAVYAVTTANDRATPRWVTGIPAAAGAATALVMPGITSHGMPAAAHARSSSPPRPNTNGSPPFRRTTVAPVDASDTSSSSISDCFIAWPPGVLPT